MAVFFVFAVPASAQNKVTGTVVDSNGDPVIGATILVKGTQNGSVTDLDGNFTLDNVASKSTLVVSYVGMKTQNVELNGRNSLHITLADDARQLDELVVVGYGQMRKSDITGALSRVTSKTIEERPVQNALQALQGKTPGVDITTNNRPGQLGDVRVRGNRSLLADNTPL